VEDGGRPVSGTGFPIYRTLRTQSQRVSIYIERVWPDTITGEGNEYKRLGYVEDEGRVVKRTGTGDESETTKVGSVDSDGTIYDSNRTRVGNVDSQGYIYDVDRRRIASVDSRGRIYNTARNWVGNAEVSGYSRYNFAWIAMAGGAGLILLIHPEVRRRRAAGFT
jgi:hypothetical protein